MAQTNTTRSAEETRERLLRVALDAFAEEGFSAVSTRKIAGRAECNIATLNYHFGSKQGLYDAVVEEVYRRLNTSSQELLPELVGAELHEVFRVVYRVGRERRAAMRILLREVLDHGRLADNTEQEHFLPSLDRFVPIVASILGIPEPRARTIVVTLSFLINRFCMQDESSLQAALGRSSIEETREEIVDILVRTTQTLMRTA